MVSARSNLVGRLGVFSGSSARDFSVGFWAAVAVELPGIADFLDFIEIELRHEQFILVTAGLLHDFSARIAEVALAVEFADLPGMLGADAIDGGDKVGVGDGMGGLLQFPKIFGEAGDGGRWVVYDFRAVESEDSGAFREVAVVADVNANAGITSLEDGIAGVSGREIKLFPEARVAMRNVVLAVFAEIAAAGVNDRGGVEIDAGHVDFVDGHDEHHLVFLRELLHQRNRGAAGNLLGKLIPAGLLLGAEIWTVEKLLQAEDLHFLLGRAGNQALVLGDHFLLDFGKRELFRGPLTLGLNQAAVNDTGHVTPPEQTQAESVLRGPSPDKFPAPGAGAGKFAGEVEPFYSGLCGSLLIIKDLKLAWGLHFQGRWGRRAEDPFRGLRAGPVRYSPLFLFAERWLGILSQALPPYPPTQACQTTRRR